MRRDPDHLPLVPGADVAAGCSAGVARKLFASCGLLMAACCSGAAHAAVMKGPCSNCHTMHNSQDDESLVPVPQKKLLKYDCIGCHSSSGSETIVTLSGGTRIPIVYNTGGYPAKPLAGGNFYKVAQGGPANDVYGHNVYGISAPDSNLDKAPGGSVDCAQTCHVSLAISTNPSYVMSHGEGGCRGCHQALKHHGVDPPPGSPETEESGWYRGVAGHAVVKVPGIEDPDWEHNPDLGHNGYSGLNSWYPYPGYANAQSMSAFCIGCHEQIHYDTVDHNNRASPWIRHPTETLLPETGEFAAYNPVDNYDAAVPVAWLDPAAPVRNGAVVMCLSCHRAHGSEYPDMLRWDYTKMITGDGIVNNTGCFKCHAAKDN